MTAAASQSSDSRQALLSHVRSLVRAEQSLTSALTATEPLLNRPTSSVLNSTPLLPLPDKSQVDTILAMAAAYSTRTSAPPMWNANLPVVGFATPNPLPHQLRGGALGGMQLKLAREELRAKELKKEQENAKKQQQMQQQQLVAENNDQDKKRKKEEPEEEEIPSKATSAKTNEMIEMQKQSVDVSMLDKSAKSSSGRNKEVVDMNLSDSSSDESDD
ncbi:hypothetical protein ACHAXN_001633 [Cyclotella atomus]